ncbi:MAG: YfiR family protein [Opitutus sp.]
MAAALCIQPITATAEERISDAYQIKAVFLFHFAQFVEWPAAAFPSRTTPFVIGILGDDPFHGYIDELVKGEKVGLHGFIVRRCQSVSDTRDCHILFICRSAEEDLASILQQLDRQSTLTVSDAESFSRHGGMVRFATESGKIRLKINVDVARQHGLAISSKILRPATTVTAGKD